MTTGQMLAKIMVMLLLSPLTPLFMLLGKAMENDCFWLWKTIWKDD